MRAGGYHPAAFILSLGAQVDDVAGLPPVDIQILKYYNNNEVVMNVRTTIEISNEMRAKLLALAARRKLRGYSGIVNEALSLYLEQEMQKEGDLLDILDLAGSLNDAEAEEAAQNIKEFRKRWDSSWIHP